MSALVIAAALLCGVPLGFILGLIAGARMYRGTERPGDDDLDYSGGL
jgi:hypothetical protein